ncbi:MAG: hypothetical protein FWC34_08330 [Bacteroidetes bacterium]|nr:hypothetical protein [Bacteroidota bacterium]MCL2302409.1 hypothetical protein [Lentimicrobiaceae bacterium]
MKKNINSFSISCLFVFLLFALCKLNGHAQFIQNVNSEEATTIPFNLKNNKISHQIQLFDEKFDVFLDNGAPKTKFPTTIIEKFFTSLPDSLICQIFPKLPNTKDYEKRVILSIGNYDLILDTIRVEQYDILFTLGAELFERRIVNLDFVNETLTLSNALPKDIDAYIAIDMSSQKHENRFGLIQHYFLIHIPDFKNFLNLNVPLVFFVDLGARGSFVADKTIKKVDYKKVINDPTLLSSLFSSEIMFNRPNLRMSYSVGGAVSELPQEEAFVDFDGWIGIDILKRFHHVIFDYQGKKLYVKTRK